MIGRAGLPAPPVFHSRFPIPAFPMRIAFVASDTSVAQQSRRKLVERYGDVPAVEAELIVALGGDGFMLRTLHLHHALDVPVYGMKLGRVGFLMNKHKLDGLPERVARAH